MASKAGSGCKVTTCYRAREMPRTLHFYIHYLFTLCRSHSSAVMSLYCFVIFSRVYTRPLDRQCGASCIRKQLKVRKRKAYNCGRLRDLKPFFNRKNKLWQQLSSNLKACSVRRHCSPWKYIGCLLLWAEFQHTAEVLSDPVNKRDQS